MNNYAQFTAQHGLTRDLVQTIVQQKQEPSWMLDFRLQAFEQFYRMPLPTWGADLRELDMENICYYLKPVERPHHSWDTVPEYMKSTFEKLGIPQAEQKLLAGVGAQFESEVIYKQLKQEWKDQGVIFCDTETALHEHTQLFRTYFSTIVPPHDNKFAALNSAVWSGGSFVYVPKGVHINKPLQAYFRIDAARMGQFERTLIIADEGSFVHYVEGCSAPVYSSSSLHSAVVEIIALPGAHVRYTTIQNWSSNVYNLVTKRAIAHEGATVEWVDGNFGSKKTMKYPCVILKGARSHARVISIAVAGNGQHQDAGSKIIHAAPHTTSHVVSKSISSGTGHASYRGLLKITPAASASSSKIQCEALLLSEQAQSDTYPQVKVHNETASVEHEASVYSMHEEQIWYLQIRGIAPSQARGLIVNGFIDVFVNELPMEYAVEINRLISLELEGSIG